LSREACAAGRDAKPPPRYRSGMHILTIPGDGIGPKSPPRR
jgi:hypothetical protein